PVALVQTGHRHVEDRAAGRLDVTHQDDAVVALPGDEVAAPLRRAILPADRPALGGQRTAGTGHAVVPAPPPAALRGVQGPCVRARGCEPGPDGDTQYRQHQRHPHTWTDELHSLEHSDLLLRSNPSTRSLDEGVLAGIEEVAYSVSRGPRARS